MSDKEQAKYNKEEAKKGREHNDVYGVVFVRQHIGQRNNCYQVFPCVAQQITRFSFLTCCHCVLSLLWSLNISTSTAMPAIPAIVLIQTIVINAIVSIIVSFSVSACKDTSFLRNSQTITEKSSQIPAVCVSKYKTASRSMGYTFALPLLYLCSTLVLSKVMSAF